MSVSAAIFGLSGPRVTPEEAAFFRALDPWGFILFARNIESPDQVRVLTATLRDLVGRADAPILIDQEGGRVQRLGPPQWPRYPAGRVYGAIAEPGERAAITYLGGRLIAHDLHQLGINVDCLPVLDVPDPLGHEIIGDRAYAADPASVADLGRAAAEGLLDGGVLPVIKHIPGHGRARADSHLELPVVEAGVEDLEARDFRPFADLADMPLAMTAHVIYAAVDRLNPATTSPEVFQQVIRGRIGFDGLVMSDDLSMKALSGDFTARARDSLAAGCDVILHCNGDMAEMQAVAEGLGVLTGKSADRAAAALACIADGPDEFDPHEARARFDAAFDGAYAA
ncbi:beta-N-acetylhexosaminidase [Phenylobacterium immobile]|uniref:beta-N-acetylhexosaminidase n=1 Tax=Phenylobacterium immobile TaxID=21 RepID=UPI000A3EA1CE|nr:beta-N-acetylhexosaminidase [Phenylobacterium immobile]